jgi:hypothetical protein
MMLVKILRRDGGVRSERADKCAIDATVHLLRESWTCVYRSNRINGRKVLGKSLRNSNESNGFDCMNVYTATEYLIHHDQN